MGSTAYCERRVIDESFDIIILVETRRPMSWYFKRIKIRFDVGDLDVTLNLINLK